MEEGRRRTQAQLEEAQTRLSEANTARQQLESAKLDLELKVRQKERGEVGGVFRILLL